MLASCKAGIQVPLAELPAWGLVCGVLWADRGFVAGSGFALHGFSLQVSVVQCLLVFRCKSVYCNVSWFFVASQCSAMSLGFSLQVSVVQCLLVFRCKSV